MNQPIKKRNMALDLLKLLTMLLIINSHSDVLYPERISFLASGGGIGNQLFFLISGYFFSAKDDVSADIRKRFVRLYIPAYLMIIITGLFGRLKVDGFLDIIKVFIWPSHFWFVGAIFVYSILLYALVKCDIEKRNRFLIFGIALLASDLILYILLIPNKDIWIVEDAYFGFVPYRSIYSILSFVMGYYLKTNKERWIGKLKKPVTVLIAAVLFIGFYGFKFMLNRNIFPMQMQIISHPLTVACALFIFLSFAQLDLNRKLDGKRAYSFVTFLAGLSLESYLVQFLIIAGVASLGIVFLLNFAVIIVFIFIAAWILQMVSSKLTGLILERHSA